MRRVRLVLAVALAVLGAACGEGVDGSGGAATTTESADDSSWAEDLGAVYMAMEASRSEAAVQYVQVFEDDAVGAYRDLMVREADTLDVAVEALPPAPQAAELSESYLAFQTALEAERDAAADVAAEMGSDFDTIAAEVDEKGDVPGTRFVEIRRGYAQVVDERVAACFQMQEALEGQNLPIFSCAPGGDDEQPAEAGLVGERLVIEAGAHQFTEFIRAGSFDFDRDVAVFVGPDRIDIADANDTDVAFEIFAVEELADPASLSPREVTATVPFALDLGTYLEKLPVTVLDSGESTVGGAPALWWDVMVDPERVEGDPVFAIAAIEAFPGVVDLFPAPMRLWTVDHPDGPVLIRAVGGGDVVEFTEAILGGFTFG